MTVVGAPGAKNAGPLSGDEVSAWREHFPILSRVTYLVNNSLGAMPDTVPGSLERYAQQWAQHGVTAWARDWFPELRRVANQLAGLLGAPPGSVVLHENVATLTSIVLSALDFSADRRRVVLSTREWPSHRYLVGEHERLGAEPTLVPTDDLTGDVEPLIRTIDERTALVIISHVDFRSARIRDVKAVARRAREAGALCMVDGYHALGHLPVDVQDIGCDFYVGGSVKWLCGGPGVAYLYVLPQLRDELAPRQVGWLGHARPFTFEDGWEAAPGAFGWLGGTPAVPAVFAAREGYTVIEKVGPERIRATSRRLTESLVEGALEQGFTVHTPLDPDIRAGAVTIDLGSATERVARELVDLGLVIDYRPEAGIRVGPHFFNTLDECAALLEALRSARGRE